MSVENSYTDFHVDFGGTSVWYHILKVHTVPRSGLILFCNGVRALTALLVHIVLIAAVDVSVLPDP